MTSQLWVPTWQESAAEDQQQLYEMLGTRTWDSFPHYLLRPGDDFYLRTKVGYALFGLPPATPPGPFGSRPFGYERKKWRSIANVCREINNVHKTDMAKNAQGGAVQEESNVLMSVIFVILKLRDTSSLTLPVFRLPKYKGSQVMDNDYGFIDAIGNKYDGWSAYLSSIKLLHSDYCYPVNGVYLGDGDGNVLLDYTLPLSIIDLKLMMTFTPVKLSVPEWSNYERSVAPFNGLGLVAWLRSLIAKHVAGSLTALDLFQYSTTLFFFTNVKIDIPILEALIKQNDSRIMTSFTNCFQLNKVRNIFRRATKTTRKYNVLRKDEKAEMGVISIFNQEELVSVLARLDTSHGTLASKDTTHGTVSGKDTALGIVAGKDTALGIVAGKDTTLGIVAGKDTARGIVAGKDTELGTLTVKHTAHATVAGKDTALGTL